MPAVCLETAIATSGRTLQNTGSLLGPNGSIHSTHFAFSNASISVVMIVVVTTYSIMNMLQKFSETLIRLLHSHPNSITN